MSESSSAYRSGVRAAKKAVKANQSILQEDWTDHACNNVPASYFVDRRKGDAELVRFEFYEGFRDTWELLQGAQSDQNMEN